MLAMDQIVRHQGRYYAYYHGLIPGSKPAEWTSAVARSPDLIHWEKFEGNPIVRGDNSSPQLLPEGRGFRLYTMHPDIRAYLPGKKSNEER